MTQTRSSRRRSKRVGSPTKTKRHRYAPPSAKRHHATGPTQLSRAAVHGSISVATIQSLNERRDIQEDERDARVRANWTGMAHRLTANLLENLWQNGHSNVMLRGIIDPPEAPPPRRPRGEWPREIVRMQLRNGPSDLWYEPYTLITPDSPALPAVWKQLPLGQPYGPRRIVDVDLENRWLAVYLLLPKNSIY